MTTPPALAAVVDAFHADLVRQGRGGDRQRIETHISLVLLAGACAYKFKKPVDFGFVDFTSLERRRYFCEREVELNRRFAPALYQGVEAVYWPGAAQTPCEYAVRMRRFAADLTLDVQVARGTATTADIAAFAERLAAAHSVAAPVAAGSRCGEPALVQDQMLACLAAPLAAQLPATLTAALGSALTAAQAELAARRAAGHVRDCHGDLHLSNVVALDGELQPFDCIEFNDELRVIDTLSDAAFLLMDLDHHGATALGHVFLNHYLAASGDYAGLTLLPLFLAYRSLVRAKVALLNGSQPSGADSAAQLRAQHHVALAERYLVPTGTAGLVITHGLSGSGKSYHAAQLAASQGFIHLRSDNERRRLSGLPLAVDSHSRPDDGRYTAAQTTATYRHLLELARTIIAAGFSVVVDATFLDRDWRQEFRAQAAACAAPFHILACYAPAAELRRRISARAAAGGDPSEATIAVLERQMQGPSTLTPEEARMAIVIDPATTWVHDADAGRYGRARPH